MITIELFGVPRLRAGTAEVQVEASTLGEALRGLARACPRLDGSVILDRWVHAAYLVSKNTEVVISDPETPLTEGDTLLVMAADAGG